MIYSTSIFIACFGLGLALSGSEYALPVLGASAVAAIITYIADNSEA
jgi:hypothetical protein